MKLMLLLPMISALLWVLGALQLKRAIELGVGAWRATFASNLAVAAFFMLLIPYGGTVHWELWWQPAGTAALFMVGQVLSYLALQQGDVSIAAPVLGTKIVIVAISTTLLIANDVAPLMWVAALLSSLAIALLNRVKSANHHHVGRTIVLAGISATMYAVFDVLVQKWSPHWGTGRFLPVLMACLAAYSLLLIPTFRGSHRDIPRKAWLSLLGGATATGFQAVLFGLTISQYGNATAANVVYSSRGLWSVILVWLIGDWFGNREQNLGADVLRWRLAGAALMTTAIALVAWQ